MSLFEGQNQQIQRGIIYLLGIVNLLQVAYCGWMDHQAHEFHGKLILDSITQSKIDSLKAEKRKVKKDTVYTFNPNFLTDYRAYRLGLNVAQIDRLLAFRKKGNFLNNLSDFQEVTGVSDSLLQSLEPQLRFPKPLFNVSRKEAGKPSKSFGTKNIGKAKALKDINTATAKDFARINGIGPVLSERIVKYRERLGGFLVKDQLNEVFGLDSTVVNRVFSRFDIVDPPQIEKHPLNEIGLEELSANPYLNRSQAKEIIDYRELNGNFQSFDELQVVPLFPADKLGRLKLYLRLK